MIKSILSFCAGMVFAGSVGAATISTLADENKTYGNFGLPNTAAYGQTFTLDKTSALHDLTFRINDRESKINFSLHLFEWGGRTTVGASLYSETGSTSGQNEMVAVTASLGNTIVGPGKYVAFFQASSRGASVWGGVEGSDPYAGGEFVYQDNGGDQRQWGSVAWMRDWQGDGSDLSFSLNFEELAVMPVPASLPLLLAGLGGLAMIRRRSKSKQAG